ncbi:hypothetical protein KY314_00345 [Candidatus Woesearchaeota archaeon]|nr:hypothetical protein [Candidatus Woesearchaeota archaeon]
MKKELSLQKKHKIAKEEHENLIKLKSFASLAYLHIGKTLKKIRDQKLYLYIFGEGGCDTFKDYLKNPEIKMSSRKAYYLIEIYETFCEELGIEEQELRGLHWTSLREIRPIVDERNVEDWLEDARELSNRDLAIKVKQETGKLKNPMVCSHQEENGDSTWKMIKYWQCSKCHATSRIRPEGWNEEDG